MSMAPVWEGKIISKQCLQITSGHFDKLYFRYEQHYAQCWPLRGQPARIFARWRMVWCCRLRGQAAVTRGWRFFHPLCCGAWPRTSREGLLLTWCINLIDKHGLLLMVRWLVVGVVVSLWRWVCCCRHRCKAGVCMRQPLPSSKTTRFYARYYVQPLVSDAVCPLLFTSLLFSPDSKQDNETIQKSC